LTQHKAKFEQISAYYYQENKLYIHVAKAIQKKWHWTCL